MTLPSHQEPLPEPPGSPRKFPGISHEQKYYSNSIVADDESANCLARRRMQKPVEDEAPCFWKKQVGCFEVNVFQSEKA